MMQYERLVTWAESIWQERWPDKPSVAIWASSECSNMIAQNDVRPGRRLRGKTRYLGVEKVKCPVVTPISDYGAWGRKMVFTSAVGAFLFKFEFDGSTPFNVLYVSSFFDDEVQDLRAIAIVPPDHLEAWAQFEGLCARAVRPKIQRRRDVYIIGGIDASFDPKVHWQDVILPETLKSQLMDDVESFFAGGVDIYRQLQLVPFRKLLLAGVPGTGKTMLCAALAKHAIDQGRVVVYVSGTDRDGATFEKIQRAFQAVAAARFPTLLIVEEIDAYLRGDDKARILNIMDGVESPNNPKGSLLVATTNYPEAIDERITKRPGRVDRIYVIPTIQDISQAEKMLRHYMAEQWQDSHVRIVSRLVGQPGAFVREAALAARMFAARERQTHIPYDMLERSVDSLLIQTTADRDFLTQRRPLGLDSHARKPAGLLGSHQWVDKD